MKMKVTTHSGNVFYPDSVEFHGETAILTYHDGSLASLPASRIFSINLIPA
jgi:hypothetical protein